MQILMIKLTLEIIVIKIRLNLLMQILKVYLGKKKHINHFYLDKNTLFFDRQIFCDFGEEFEVIDTNGENPLTQIVTEISHVRN